MKKYPAHNSLERAAIAGYYDDKMQSSDENLGKCTNKADLDGWYFLRSPGQSRRCHPRVPLNDGELWLRHGSRESNVSRPPAVPAASRQRPPEINGYDGPHHPVPVQCAPVPVQHAPVPMQHSLMHIQHPPICPQQHVGCQKQSLEIGGYARSQPLVPIQQPPIYTHQHVGYQQQSSQIDAPHSLVSVQQPLIYAHQHVPPARRQPHSSAQSFVIDPDSPPTTELPDAPEERHRYRFSAGASETSDNFLI